MVYAVVFLLEVLLRLVASGFSRYIFGSGWSWNWLDVFVVTSTWVELLVNLFAPRCIHSPCVSTLPPHMFCILLKFRIHFEYTRIIDPRHSQDSF